MYQRYILVLFAFLLSSLGTTAAADCTTNTGYNSTLLFPADFSPIVDGQPIPDDTEIRILASDGECVGEMTYVSDSQRGQATPVWGEDVKLNAGTGVSRGDTILVQVRLPASNEWQSVETTLAETGIGHPDPVYGKDRLFSVADFSLAETSAPDYADEYEPAGMLLDEQPGAHAAYSLRQLRAAYDGPVVRVRRSADGEEREFGFTSGGELEITAIESWLSGADGRLVKWYSQYGDHPPLIPDEGTHAPFIARGGSVVRSPNGRPRVDFTDGNAVLEPAGDLPDPFAMNDFSASLVVETTGGDTWGGGIQLLTVEPDGDWTHDRPELVARADDSDYKIRKLRESSGGVISAPWDWQVLTVSLSSSDFRAYANDDNKQTFSNPETGDAPGTRFQLGGTPRMAAWKGYIGELVIYSSLSGESQLNARYELIDGYWRTGEDAPAALAADDRVEGPEDTSLTIDVLSNDAPAVTIQSASGAENGTVEVTDNQRLRYTPGLNFNGEEQLTYTVKTSAGESGTASVSVTVTPVNDAPTIAPIAPTKVVVGKEYSSTIDASDVDGDELSFTGENVPDWLSLTTTGAAAARLAGVPGDEHVGTYHIGINVSDADTTITQSFSLQVESDISENPPGPPTVTILSRDIAKGWNLVGVPFQVEDSTRRTVYPSATPNTLFAFGGELRQRPALTLGRGYFLHFGGEQSISMSGDEVASLAVSLSRGWNLVSGPSCTVPVEAIKDPDEVVDAVSIYGFDSTYVVAESIDPAEGYWIRASGAGTIRMDCEELDSAGKTQTADYLASVTEDYESISVRDASGARQVLYLNGTSGSTTANVSFAMPPLPPEGAFDVRFSNEEWLIDGASGTVELQSSNYPVNLELGEGVSTARTYIAEELVNGEVVKTHHLSAGGSVEITNSDVRQVRLAAETSAAGRQIPDAFELHGNYPNPFNPQTNISFSLPEQADVKVTVYNTVGARMMELAPRTMSAGQQTLTLDGSRLSSGMYLYRVTMSTAENVHVKVGQMTLVK